MTQDTLCHVLPTRSQFSKRKASSSSYVAGACSLTGHLVFLQDFTAFGNWLDIAQAIGQNECRSFKSKSCHPESKVLAMITVQWSTKWCVSCVLVEVSTLTHFSFPVSFMALFDEGSRSCLKWEPEIWGSGEDTGVPQAAGYCGFSLPTPKQRPVLIPVCGIHGSGLPL